MFGIIFPATVQGIEEYALNYLSSGRSVRAGMSHSLVPDRSNKDVIIQDILKNAVRTVPPYVTIESVDKSIAAVLQPLIEALKAFFRRRFPPLEQENITAEAVGMIKDQFLDFIPNTVIYLRTTDKGSVVFFYKILTVNPQTGRPSMATAPVSE